jgi:hypothetical protein
MGWLASIVVGVLTALATMLAAGYVANLAAGWYRVSSFEGASGYFVVGLALLGLIVGLGIGLAAARLVAAGAHPGFLKALGLGLAVALGAVGIVGGIARLRADVAPRFRGEELALAVEFRWPPGQPLPPGGDAGEWFLQLGSASGRTRRATRTGPLWREDARLEEGRWIVPGAVDVFTSRGDRIIDVSPQGIIPHGFVIPLPARPGAAQLEWSQWLPRPRDGNPAPSDGVSYRFRVVPESRPLRSETFGPFEVATISHGLGETTIGNGPPVWTADAEFTIRHRGESLLIGQLERMSAVAVAAGPAPALLVQVGEGEGAGTCYLVVSEVERVRVERAGRCDPTVPRLPLTNDPVVFSRARDLTLPAGRVDRSSLAQSGWFLLGETVLDTGTLTLQPVPETDRQQLIERIPPVGLAPDRRSFVRLAWGERSSDDLALAVIRLDTGEQYRLPIDQSRMRLFSIDQIDPAWVLHHFEWRRTTGDADRLAERSGFTPLPYHGELSLDRSGYREYRVGPALEGLRPALIDFLVTEFRGERLPAGVDDYAHEVRIGAVVVNVSFSASDAHVGVWVDRGTDSRLVARIAERFDAELATRRLDHLFGR